MLLAMNSTVMNGTPRTNSMKTTLAALTMGRLERRPSASSTPSGSENTMPTSAVSSETNTPPHSRVSTTRQAEARRRRAAARRRGSGRRRRTAPRRGRGAARPATASSDQRGADDLDRRRRASARRWDRSRSGDSRACARRTPSRRRPDGRGTARRRAPTTPPAQSPRANSGGSAHRPSATSASVTAPESGDEKRLARAQAMAPRESSGGGRIGSEARRT